MNAIREMRRVTETNSPRQVVVACPSCRRGVGLWLCLQPPGEYQRDHSTVDLTASLLEPSERAAAMRRSVEMAEKSTLTPWVTCLACGYDDHYFFGSTPTT